MSTHIRAAGSNETHVTAWHKNGKKSMEFTWVDFKKEGLYTEWHPNGKKKAEGKYVDDVRYGLWTHWKKNGKLERTEKLP